MSRVGISVVTEHTAVVVGIDGRGLRRLGIPCQYDRQRGAWTIPARRVAELRETLGLPAEPEASE